MGGMGWEVGRRCKREGTYVYLWQIRVDVWHKPTQHCKTAPAAAKSLQSCPTLCDPMDSSPPGSSVHRILQARILECIAISFSNCKTTVPQ